MMKLIVVFNYMLRKTKGYEKGISNSIADFEGDIRDVEDLARLQDGVSKQFIASRNAIPKGSEVVITNIIPLPIIDARQANPNG